LFQVNRTKSTACCRWLRALTGGGGRCIWLISALSRDSVGVHKADDVHVVVANGPTNFDVGNPDPSRSFVSQGRQCPSCQFGDLDLVEVSCWCVSVHVVIISCAVNLIPYISRSVPNKKRHPGFNPKCLIYYVKKLFSLLIQPENKDIYFVISIPFRGLIRYYVFYFLCFFLKST
jgi:hypothetical protein